MSSVAVKVIEIHSQDVANDAGHMLLSGLVVFDLFDTTTGQDFQFAVRFQGEANLNAAVAEAHSTLASSLQALAELATKRREAVAL